MSEQSHVLVIGGGPGGSTAASLLAREGFRVTLMERDRFPRYHIGESLQPSCLRVLDLVGARDKVATHGFLRKAGVLFDWGSEEWEMNFGSLPQQFQYSWQVIRSEFDKLLLDHAREQGVAVHEGTEVVELRFDGDRPTSALYRQAGNGTESSEVAFDYLVDASGRAGLMATRYLKSRRYPESFQNVAVWSYWTGARKLDHGPENAIAVCTVPAGWLWAIPLHDGTTSIGLVTHKTSFKERKDAEGGLRGLLLDAIAGNPIVARLVETGEMAPEIKVEQDYSYLCDRFAGPGYFIVGDAACFLDPLLSSGVHLATFSAMVASASIAEIERGKMDPSEVCSFYDQHFRSAFLRMMVLVSAFYEQYAGKDTYFWEAQTMTRHEYPNSDVKAAFVNIVAGMEDLHDSQKAADYAVAQVVDAHKELKRVAANPRAVATMGVEERERFKAKAELFGTLFVDRAGMSPETAVGGMYVTLPPRLGLARA